VLRTFRFELAIDTMVSPSDARDESRITVPAMIAVCAPRRRGGATAVVATAMPTQITVRII
jgi:hypothetical protein